MRLEAKKCLYDIQEAADLLTKFVQDKIFADYERDAMLRSAVERQFEIIGEALSKLAKLDERYVLSISEHKRIIAFRNILIHGYAQVDDRLVWDVLVTKLPVLWREVTEIMKQG